MNQTKSDQILWVDTLKGACILLVVLYHTVLPGFEGTMKYLSAGWIPAEIWIQFNTVLSPLRMPAFFFVSGLLATNGILNRPLEAGIYQSHHQSFYLYILWGFIQWWSIIGISTEITGQRISQNLNAAYAGSLFEFLKTDLYGHEYLVVSVWAGTLFPLCQSFSVNISWPWWRWRSC
ncbi:Inner membrane protein YcfT [Pantoea agglomerans]|uniref:Inner membrane protein YcfT n=1 Tax=Enterobacter agglomerans TaxID=549 RepID=A0A379AEI7_ENTAG|nr:Inner membrane protein YcfT [Pantoea agglomerans]